MHTAKQPPDACPRPVLRRPGYLRNVPDTTLTRTLALLRAAGDVARAEHDRAYLKSDMVHWGVSVPEARKAVRLVGPLPHDDLLELVAALWAQDVYDARLAAALLLERRASDLAVQDLGPLETLLRQSGTWSLVDVLAPRPVAAIDARDPLATTSVLDRWAVDHDFWLRRSALLAHLIPLRAGGGDWERFTRYADGLLRDREFFVRKAIGWVLREAGRHRPDLVRDWVAARTDLISGVALREAVKPLAADDAAELLAAYRARRPASARRTG